MRLEVPCSPRPAVLGMPATTPVPLKWGRTRWPEIQTHQAMIAAMRRSERMRVVGVATAAHHRAGRGVWAQVVSGEACAARSSVSEASAESPSGTKAAARVAAMAVDVNRQIPVV
jgi:hypothetical protein